MLDYDKMFAVLQAVMRVIEVAKSDEFQDNMDRVVNDLTKTIEITTKAAQHILSAFGVSADVVQEILTRQRAIQTDFERQVFAALSKKEG